MSPAEELKVLGDFAVSTFGVRDPLPERAGPLPHLDPSLLAKHKGSIKPNKAVQPLGSSVLTK